MAKRKTATATKPEVDEGLPRGVKWIQVSLPVYVDELDRPRIYRVQAPLDSQDESNAVQRLFHAHYLMHHGPYGTSYSNVVREVLRRIADAIPPGGP